MSSIALLPGTFDPITLGHVDLVKRALNLFDEVVIGVSTADGKSPLLNLDKRMDLVKSVFKDNPKISVTPLSGLLVDFLQENNIKFLLRGLRNPDDTSYELEMLDMNRALSESKKFTYETVFLFPSDKLRYISSSRVREIFKLGGDISSFVPPEVLQSLRS